MRRVAIAINNTNLNNVASRRIGRLARARDNHPELHFIVVACV
jgi:hypothetical protein